MANSTVLQTTDLTKKFGGMTAVDSVDIKFQRGIVTAIIGPNGAGKTTLFNLLSGVLTPTRGTITYEDRDITTESPEEISQLGIARSFQLTQIFPALTALENVRLAAQSRGGPKVTYDMLSPAERYEDFVDLGLELLRRVGLEDDYTTLAGDLTRADQRKLDLTMAIATKPNLLMLDEPTAGMAVEEIPEILDIIEEIGRDRAGLSILLIEHKIDIVMDISDSIAVLANGQLLATGSPQEIKEDEQVQQAYLGGMR